MKKLFQIFAITLFTLSVSCKKESDPTPAMLSVEDIKFELSDGKPNAELIINNDGDESLNWEITNTNNIIKFSEQKGELTKGAYNIDLSFRKTTPPGVYHLDFIIKSNGGSVEVDVKLEIKERTGIMPGDGIYGVPLYSEYEYITDIYGLPEKIYSQKRKDYNLYFNEAFYPDYGVSFIFISVDSAIIDKSDVTGLILLLHPFREKTKEKISIMSMRSTIGKAFGSAYKTEPYLIQNEDFSYIQYPTKGINFLVRDSDALIYFIEIFGAYTPESAITTKSSSLFTEEVKDYFIRNHFREGILKHK